MECKLDSPCQEIMYCESSEDKILSDLWIDFNTLMTGLLVIFSYFLYRLLKDLPALITWPVRFILSFTGLSFLWNSVNLLVYTARGLLTVLRFPSHVWRFFGNLLSLSPKIGRVAVIIKTVTGFLRNINQYCECMIRLPSHAYGYTKSFGMLSTTTLTSHIRDPGIRLILTGPSREDCGFLRDSLLGYNVGALFSDKESTNWRANVNGREVTVVETPNLFGPSLCARRRALEAFRSLQLASPGPHAFLLVLPTIYLDQIDRKCVSDFLVKLLKLFGEEAAKYVLIAFTFVDPWSTCSAYEQLLEEAHLEIKSSLLTCGRRFELVNISPGWSMKSRMARGRMLLKRVAEMRTQQDHYIHEFQRREDYIRKELLNDMAEKLAQNLIETGNIRCKFVNIQ